MHSAHWTLQQILRYNPHANGTMYCAARLSVVHMRDSLVWSIGLRIGNKEAMSVKEAMSLHQAVNVVLVSQAKNSGCD